MTRTRVRSTRWLVVLGLVQLVVLCAGLVVAFASSGTAPDGCADALQELAGRVHLPVECAR